ncbi:hypothetical protein [Hahella ganghwensis]|uniref:hypothetical protein n=1 Tax=Hahella ganghwensis TaxID=286420 RepID=UPI0003808A75|nr:hypothetical protein [Hahella ganghwensis]
MKEQRWMIIIAILLAILLSYEAFAKERFSVDQDTAEAFTGSYLVDGNKIRFQSSLIDSDKVLFSVDINGSLREATLHLDQCGQSYSGRYQSCARNIEFSQAAVMPLSMEQQVLMYDTMNTVSEYFVTQPRELHSPALVLVSAMGYWSLR